MYVAIGLILAAAVAGAQDDQPQPDLMSINEVAALTRKSRHALYSMRYTNTGPPSFRLGRRLVYRRADVLAWIESHAAADKHLGRVSR
jgi:predicted DNA-binding transcriptional regulator AlpA